jgi:ABC-type multidrug transport system fused ATPase/permease subunit
LSLIFRNYYIMYGMISGITIRRTLVSYLFSKVARLSMKSLNETNSGKLVSLISADMFQAERGMAFIPHIVAGPII